MRTSRIALAGAVAAIAAGSVTLSPATQAKAATAATASRPPQRPAVLPVAHRVHMGSYGASRFAKAAANLPSGLSAQLHRQLGITPVQFLADGQAAADAGKVIAALRADGVPVLGAKLKGTALTVTVRDTAAAAAAEAAGAEAVVGTAQPVETVKAKALSSPADGSSKLLGGDFWFYFTDTITGEGAACSTGFNGYAKSTGAKEFLTAGHCADYQDTGDQAPANGFVYAATDTNPVTLFETGELQDPRLGSLDQPSFHFGGGQDAGVVDVTDAAAKPAPAVNTWGSRDTTAGSASTASQGVENSGGTVPVLAAAVAVTGEPVCHSGARTGWQCGTVKNADAMADVETAAGSQTVDGFVTSVCDLPGDSGGSFVSGEYAVGVTSAGSFTPKSGSGAGYNSCSGSGFTLAHPMIAAASGEESAAHSEPGFELAVSVPAPIVSTYSGNAVTGDGTIGGYLPGQFATGTPVSLSLDGHQKASATVDTRGGWSFSLASLGDGVHRYTVTAGSGHSTASTSGAFTMGQVIGIKAPSVSGTVKVGAKVAASPGTWSAAALAFTYQWLDNGKAIGGGTSASYTVPASLAGTKLSVTVTAHKSGYHSAAKTSAALTVAKGTLALTVKPKLSGAPQAGKKLTVTRGTWNPAPAIAIQWYANGKPVAHATGTSLNLTTALTGKTISVAVTASKTGYATAAVRLTESSKVKAA